MKYVEWLDIPQISWGELTVDDDGFMPMQSNVVVFVRLQTHS